MERRFFSTGFNNIYCYFSDKTLPTKVNVYPDILQVLKPKLVCKFTIIMLVICNKKVNFVWDENNVIFWPIHNYLFFSLKYNIILKKDH